MSCRNYTSKTRFLKLLVASVLYAPVCWAEFSSDFLFFPHAMSMFRFGLDDQPEFDGDHHHALEKDHYEAAVDLFFTIEAGNFRFLGEYLFSTEEQHMERFQAGWLIGNHMIWLGRFHNPVGYWNTRHHHGAYLQTSISRPSLARYEEHGGILPMHQAGLLLEGMFERGDSGLGYSLALANGPEYTGRLEPWDVLNPSAGEQDVSITLNFFQEIASGRHGLFANYSKIPSTIAPIVEIKQRIAGGYLDWEFERWTWHASVFYVDNDLVQKSGSEKDSFFNAYVQGEYRMSEQFRLFGRIEGTAGGEDDAYLELFPNFIEDRVLAGIRFDFASHNALKLEFSANRTQREDFGELSLQWSAQF